MTWEVMPWLALIELNYLPHLCPHRSLERSIVYGTVQHPLGKSTHSYSQEAWVFRKGDGGLCEKCRNPCEPIR